jgi:hypothetical protein
LTVALLPSLVRTMLAASVEVMAGQRVSKVYAITDDPSLRKQSTEIQAHKHHSQLLQICAPSFR